MHNFLGHAVLMLKYIMSSIFPNSTIARVKNQVKVDRFILITLMTMTNTTCIKYYVKIQEKLTSIISSSSSPSSSEWMAAADVDALLAKLLSSCAARDAANLN